MGGGGGCCGAIGPPVPGSASSASKFRPPESGKKPRQCLLQLPGQLQPLASSSSGRERDAGPLLLLLTLNMIPSALGCGNEKPYCAPLLSASSWLSPARSGFPRCDIYGVPHSALMTAWRLSLFLSPFPPSHVRRAENACPEVRCSDPYISALRQSRAFLLRSGGFCKRKFIFLSSSVLASLGKRATVLINPAPFLYFQDEQHFTAYRDILLTAKRRN